MNPGNDGGAMSSSPNSDEEITAVESLTWRDAPAWAVALRDGQLAILKRLGEIASRLAQHPGRSFTPAQMFTPLCVHGRVRTDCTTCKDGGRY